LYTIIPHDLHIQALDWVSQQAWGCHTGKEAVPVCKDFFFTTEKPEWLPCIAAKPAGTAYT
jgi:hypothetical protein